MAKIDVANIEGYESMSVEEKLAALEAYEYEDNGSELARMKAAVSKANSEAAEWKRKHNAHLTEAEQKEQEREAEFEALKKEAAELRRSDAINKHKAGLLAAGFDSALAEESASALVDGDFSKMIGNLGKYKTMLEKNIKDELLKNTKEPPAGAGKTAEQIKEEKLTADIRKSMGLPV